MMNASARHLVCAIACTSFVACHMVSGLDVFFLAGEGGAGGSANVGGGIGEGGEGGEGGGAGGCSNGVLVFDGVDDRVVIEAGSDYAIAGPFTIELWFRQDEALTSEMRLASYSQQSAAGYNLALSDFTNPLGRTWFRLYEPDVKQVFHEVPSVGVWHHIAGVWNGNDMEVFLDGEPSGEPTSTAVVGFDGKLVIGASSNADNLFFEGAIDEVRISNVARYVAAFTPEARFAPDAETLGLWHFDEGGGNVTADAVADNDGTLEDDTAGGPQWAVACFP